MIKLLVDSSSDYRKPDGVCDYFVPLTVSLGDSNYKDGVDLDADTFYNMLTSTKEFPKTAQPSPQDFADIFEEVKESGDELICILLSSALSGTYQSAMIAKSMVEYDKIYLIDSLTATHMIGVLAEYAAGLIREGLPAPEICEKCDAIKGKIKAIAGIDSLEFLYRGGRLSKTSATVGSVANIKPIITVSEEGKVDNIKKLIGRKKATSFIISQMESMQPDDSFPMYSIYTFGEENTAHLEKKLYEETGYVVKERVQVGPTIGSHIGPGAYGIIFVTK